MGSQGGSSLSFGFVFFFWGGGGGRAKQVPFVKLAFKPGNGAFFELKTAASTDAQVLPHGAGSSYEIDCDDDQWFATPMVTMSGMIRYYPVHTEDTAPGAAAIISLGDVAVDESVPNVFGSALPDDVSAEKALGEEQSQRNIGWSEDKGIGLSAEQMPKIPVDATGAWLFIQNKNPFPATARRFISADEFSLRAPSTTVGHVMLYAGKAGASFSVSYITRHDHWEQIAYGRPPRVTVAGDLYATGTAALTIDGAQISYPRDDDPGDSISIGHHGHATPCNRGSCTTG